MGHALQNLALASSLSSSQGRRWFSPQNTEGIIRLLAPKKDLGLQDLEAPGLFVICGVRL